MKHHRTTPKIFARAKELRREMTSAEIKLYAHLRAHRMGGVHFRPQHTIEDASHHVTLPKGHRFGTV